MNRTHKGPKNQQNGGKQRKQETSDINHTTKEQKKNPSKIAKKM